ncbi:alpha/beta fold hydrolase [uncultured Ruegeria sp.]|uniref:alpha/beta hydrolase n=1 Tax=uncultured Ruegeria sp. TaxID=259304 RepID=UPI00261D899E|nr:alpha/beta fold hydrolase [uncultured Ruegeria sp.]
MLDMSSWRAVFAISLFVCATSVTAQSDQTSSGQVVELRVPAPSLEENLLGTSGIQDVAIYLPPDYEQHPNRRFPVLYLLHGIFDDYGVWIENYNVPSILDRMIQDDAIPEVIAVMPNAGNRYGGGYYRNSPVSGNWADYITNDLVSYVDANYSTLPNPESRAVIGHSMGGYGALHLAMHHPGVFSVVWAISPCCLAPTEDLGFGNDAWKRASQIEDFDDVDALLESRDFYPIAILGIIAAFNPDPDNEPIYGDFPFEIVKGEVVLDDQAFDSYSDAFPIRQVRASRENLRELKGLGMGVGLGDQFLHIPAGTLALSQQLGDERIPHSLDVYAGDHRQRVGERLEETVIPWVVRRLDFGE